jgi:RNA polymerase primary sigma factor
MDAPFVQGEENSLLDVLENDGDEKPDDGLMTDSLRKEVQRPCLHLRKVKRM